MGYLTDGFYSLFARFNKTKGSTADHQEGVVDISAELELSMNDEDLIEQKKDWEKKWKGSASWKRVNEEGDTNERYWAGRQFPDTEYENGKRPLVDNITFEAVETVLPIASQQNPDPVVNTDNTPEMNKLAEKVMTMLVYLSQTLNLKTKIKKMVRHWSMRYIGILKIGWNAEKNEIDLKVVRPKDIILDPNGYVEDGIFHGDYIGELTQDTAKNLIVRFPKKEKEIKEMCGDKLGSLFRFTQWWTNEYVFFTLGDIVLAKSKNPHWNYDKETESVDEYGKPIKKALPGKNHLPIPMMPYMFLGVFTLGDEPVDKTSLVAQGLVLQDAINKRLKQIDRNADNTNGGAVVSGQFFNKEQAGQVSDALRQGRTVVVPTGDINQAYKREQGPALPNFIYQSLKDYRDRYLEIFGVSGSTPQGVEDEDTVRGKIITANQDTSRIGGGITEYIEQVAALCFNWMVQMMYVYYDTSHVASIMGPNNALEYITLESNEFPADRKLYISVQPGSLIPKNDMTERNEAIDLWNAEALAPKALFERLHDSNPTESAIELMTYKLNPAAYLQSLTGQPAQGGQLPPQTSPEGDMTLPQAPPGVNPTPPPVPAQESALLKEVPMNKL